MKRTIIAKKLKKEKAKYSIIEYSGMVISFLFTLLIGSTIGLLCCDMEDDISFLFILFFSLLGAFFVFYSIYDYSFKDYKESIKNRIKEYENAIEEKDKKAISSLAKYTRVIRFNELLKIMKEFDNNEEHDN